ncbi:MAG: pyruvoyl-dependent arginine decarboxylase [Methanomassiliicoccaceae archaeon]|jgi:arginine decarboxylase|nr:pyruvoyl-dependent arginine decarboxylase [Methanomassiliicoccaceae archaeon]
MKMAADMGKFKGHGDDKCFIPNCIGNGMYLVPSAFFVASASAVSSISELNAFDKALIKMGIGEQNLVAVSSVIPEGAAEIPAAVIPMGAVTHCVLAQIRGSEGERISAGIAYAFRKDGKGGYVAEGRSHGPKTLLLDSLNKKMEEIAACRNVGLREIRYNAEELSVPPGHYGACVAALVFTGYE